MKQRQMMKYSPVALAVAMALGTAPAYAAIAPDDPVGAPANLLDLSGGNIQLTGTATAMDADGDATFVWNSRNTDTGMEGVYYRRIHADGSVGDPRTLLEESDADVSLGVLDVAMDADGDALVAWTVDRVSEPGLKVEARRIAADGEPADAAFDVTGDVSADVSVGMDAAGNAAIAWQYAGNILFQRYSATGTPLTETAQQANTTSTGNQHAQISVGPNGDFVVGWLDGSQNLKARPYSPVIGDPVTDEIMVASGVNQWPARFAMDADGNFSAAWSHYTSTYLPSGDPMMGGGSYAWHVNASAKRFDANGNVLAGPVSLYSDSDSGPTSMPPSGMEPAIQTLSYGMDGNIIVGWNRPDLSFVRSRVMADSSKTDLPTGFVCSGDTFATCLEDLENDADDDRMIVYRAFDEPGTLTGIQAQRYKGPENADLAATLTTNAPEVAVGDPLTLTLAIENLHVIEDYYGNTAMDQAIGAAAGVQVELDLPAPFALPADSGGWTCTDVEGGASCVHPEPLHAGDTVTMAAVYEPTADDVGEYLFAATASATPIDPATENNAANTTVTIIPAPKPDNTGDNVDDTDDGDAGTGDGSTVDMPPVGGGGGALGWLALLLASLRLSWRRRIR